LSLACLFGLVFYLRVWQGANPRGERLIGSGLTPKYETKLDRLSIDKQSSLIGFLVGKEKKGFGMLIS
jgi:hypothetical protein